MSYLDSLALHVPDKSLRSDNPGYLEAQSMHHKTQRLKSKQGVPLVMVAPIRGLHRTAWGTIFHGQCMVHRKALMAGTTSPLLTGINADGSWLCERLSSSEANAWLSRLLTIALVDEPPVKATTRSLKPTLISWCMKSGSDDVTLKMLGHHSTTECYGRDAMSAPLKELVSVIRSVASRAFRPDESRSGQFVGVCASGVARESATEEPAPEERSAGASSQPHFPESEAFREDTVGAFDKEPSSSTSDSESSSDTESIPDEGRIPKPGDQLAAMLVPRAEWAWFGDVFENPNSRKLHLRPTASTTMACGRPEKGLILFKSRIFEEGDKCQQCAAAKPVRTLAGLNQQLDERSKKSARTSA